jgi:hypothetical protein
MSAHRIAQAEGLQQAGEILAAGRWIFPELIKTKDPLAVARMARPDGSEQELERLARVFRDWLDKQEAKRQQGAT